MQTVTDYFVKAARGGFQARCGGLQAMRRALAAFLLANSKKNACVQGVVQEGELHFSFASLLK